MGGWFSKDFPVTAVYKIPPDEPIGPLGPGWTVLTGSPTIASRNETPPDSPLYPMVLTPAFLQLTRVLYSGRTVPSSSLAVRFSCTIIKYVLSYSSYMLIGDGVVTPGVVRASNDAGGEVDCSWNGAYRIGGAINPGINYDFRFGLEIVDGLVRGYSWGQTTNIRASAVEDVNMNQLIQIGTPMAYTPTSAAYLGIEAVYEGSSCKDFWIEVLGTQTIACPKASVNPVWPMPA